VTLEKRVTLDLNDERPLSTMHLNSQRVRPLRRLIEVILHAVLALGATEEAV